MVESKNPSFTSEFREAVQKVVGYLLEDEHRHYKESGCLSAADST
jgi:hypothetical protein